MDALIQRDDNTKRYSDAGPAALDGIGRQVTAGVADDLTILDNVLLPAQLAGARRADARARADITPSGIKVRG